MRQLTGTHVAALFGGGFAIIIAANLALAVNAVRSFPGLEVANSYVASQSFQARRDAQQALGWRARAAYDGTTLSLDLSDATGAPAPVEDLTAHIGRPTEARDDKALQLDARGRTSVTLAPGLWRLDVAGHAPDGTAYQKALEIRVRP